MPTSNEPCHKCNCADKSVDVMHPEFAIYCSKRDHAVWKYDITDRACFE